MLTPQDLSKSDRSFFHDLNYTFLHTQINLIMMVLSNFFAEIKVKKKDIYLVSLGIVCVCVCRCEYILTEKRWGTGENDRKQEEYFTHNLKIGYLLPNK